MTNILALLLLVRLTPEPVANGRVIVEFHGQPAARTGGVVAASHRDTLVRFRRDLSEGIVSQSAERRVPRIRHEYSAVFFGAAIEIDPAEVPRIRALPYVKAVHPDRTVEAYASSAAELTDAATRVNASSLPSRGRGITVGVIDTGIDYRHPDLGAGYGPGFKVAGGWDFVNDDADPIDDHGHGTHVAGIVAANGPTIAGVAPEATLIAYKSLARNGAGSESAVIAALEHSADPNRDGNLADHLDVVNMSLGGPGHAGDPIARASDHAMAAGVIVVAAAGNDGKIVTVGTPGAARDIITVGAHDATAVTDFSSRGPTAGDLLFKPDVVAPGEHINSLKVGGGYIVYSGTSMAAPHVAGVAALLRALHPDWTPADMKAALVSGVTAIGGTPFVRGAGRVDAQRAHEAKVFARDSGLSFGLLASRSGTFQATRSFTLENRSAVAQTLTLETPSVPAGVTIAVTPASLSLAPREKRTVDVHLTADNAVLPFAEEPQQRLIGGDIVVSGTTSLNVPWAFLRSGRVTVAMQDVFALVVAFEAGNATGAAMVRPYKLSIPAAAEMFVRPGQTFSYAAPAMTSAPDPESFRLIFAGARTVAGDDVVEIRAADAPLRIAFATRDKAGVPLSARAEGPLTRRTTSILWTRGTYEMDISVFRSLGELFVSPAPPESDALEIGETTIDLAAMEAYTIQYPVVRGFSEPKTFAYDASSLLNARFQLEPVGTTLYVCSATGDVRLTGSNILTRWCVERRGKPQGTFDYYTTDPGDPLVVNGIQIRTGAISTPPIRAFQGSVIATWDNTPSPATRRIAGGATATVGAGPVFPLGLPGTTAGIPLFRPRPGFYGSLDEQRGIAGGFWSLFSPDGQPLGGGTLDGPPGSIPIPLPRQRYVVRHDTLLAAGRPSQGLLEVTYGAAGGDIAPPAITSLRIADRNGRNTDRLTRGEAATLHFSAADFDYSQATQTLPTRPEATRAWVRAHGTANWIALPLTIEGSESGNGNELRHMPAGDLYRAALGAATAMNDTLFDLRIELEDLAGNRAVWTQSPAFMVGAVSVPPRRRSVR